MTNTTRQELIETAIASGEVTREQIDACIAQWPYMAEDRWWVANAQQDPVRAVQYRVEKLERLLWEKEAREWSDDELKAVVRQHKSGEVADTDKLAEACRRGLISMSAAMNSDF